MVKNHHYVPQYYLKQFKYKSSPKNRQHYVYYHFKDWNNNEVKNDKIRNLCCERGFYLSDPDNDYMEDVFLNKLDNYFANRIYYRLLKKGSIRQISIRERLILCEFISFMRFRGLPTRELILNSSEELDYTFSDEEIKRIHNRHLLYEKFLDEKERGIIKPFWNSKLLECMYDCVFNNTIHIIKNNLKSPFITSDNPVIINGAMHEDQEWFSFPLSPKLLVIFYPITMKGKIPFFATESLLYTVNMNILNTAYKTVISNNREYLKSILQAINT